MDNVLDKAKVPVRKTDDGDLNEKALKLYKNTKDNLIKEVKFEYALHM